MASLTGKVFRLRGIPDHFDRLLVARFVSDFIDNGDVRDVEVKSLAFNRDDWAASRTKTATLSFLKLPRPVDQDPKASEWSLLASGLRQPLLLDNHFIGLTPLNDILDREDNTYCIVLSGLASHPMGSWMPHGGDKSFMWVRDALPAQLGGVSFYLYGYDTKLAGSNSVQVVSDIAGEFLQALRQGGWALPGPRDLAFFAHSLGGVVLKEAFRLAANSSKHRDILARTKAGILFGVPSQGVDTSEFDIMIEDQPNKDKLVRQISSDSSYLEQLEVQFVGITLLQRIDFTWAYETQTSATIAKHGETFKKDGPRKLFVTPESATGNRVEKNKDCTMAIDADHSAMVKFSPGSPLIESVAFRLKEMLASADENSQTTTSSSQDLGLFNASQVEVDQFSFDLADPSLDPSFWDYHALAQSIKVQERDDRLKQVDTAAGRSFEWAFDENVVGLEPWLRSDDKLFWISGKPASGKSTMMKYLHQNPRTQELIKEWRRSDNFAQATFFFHHRGTAGQKSFHGLLCGLLSQILEQAPQTLQAIQSVLDRLFSEALQSQGLPSLSQELKTLIEWSGSSQDDEVNVALQRVLACELPRKSFHSMVVKPMLSQGLIIPDSDIEEIVFSRIKELQAIISKEDGAKAEDECRETAIRIATELASQGLHTASYLESFFPLLEAWLVKINPSIHFGFLKQVLTKRTPISQATPEQMRVTLDQLIKKALRQFLARQDCRRQIETTMSSWSTRRLREAIDAIMGQQQMPLDLCLFLDALDEHDGTPDSISNFIQEMSNAEESSTRIKILFSSRPWAQFDEAFGQGPGFKMHEHTEGDIRELCMHAVREGAPGAEHILDLSDEIVSRAQGVFMWVKLVLSELSQCASESIESGNDIGESSARLLDKLSSLPPELSDFYRLMVSRIPSDHRRDAFCLLEVVSKSDNDVLLDDVAKILLASKVSNIAQRCDLRSCPPMSEQDVTLRTGGLIEFVRSSSSPERKKLQFLHQTMAEYVQHLNFVRELLGEDCRHVKDTNGYTFLAKYDILSMRTESLRVFHLIELFSFSANNGNFSHALKAEATTGRSLYSFLKADVPWELNMHRDQSVLPEYTSLLAVAVHEKLELLVKDILENEPSARSDTKASLVDALEHCPTDRNRSDETDRAIKLMSNMIEWGFSRVAFETLFLRFIGSSRATYASPDDHFVKKLINTFFEPELIFKIANLANRSSYPKHLEKYASKLVKYHRSWGTFHALHFGVCLAADSLIDEGADPNCLTSQGLTPLDCRIKFWSFGMHSPVKEIRLLHGVKALIQRGGRLNVCREEEWLAAMAKVAESVRFEFRWNVFIRGADDFFLPEGIPDFPGWLHGAPVMKGTRNPRRAGCDDETPEDDGTEAPRVEESAKAKRWWASPFLLKKNYKEN